MKKFMLFLILLISIVGVSCVCAADVNDDVTVPSVFAGETLDVDGSLSKSLQCEDDSDADDPDDGEKGFEEFYKVDEDFLSDSDEFNQLSGDFDDNTTGNSQQDDDKGNNSLNITGLKIVENHDSNNTVDDNGDKEIPVIPVNTPGTFEDLQLLINNAKEGSTLYLTKNYYGPDGARITINKNLIINGLYCYINCQGAKDCFAFYSTMGDITLRNLNIINGRNDYNQKGGAIYIGGSAKYTLINCNFINNWADDYGGAIYNDVNMPLTIKKCTFRGNTADDDDGGAIFSKGPLYVENSTFESNKADDYGGAIHIDSDVESTFKGCVFNSNVAGDNNGGGIFSKGDLNLEDCIFDSNRALVDGGAVYSNKIVNVWRSVFKNNAATGATSSQCYGGAICSKETVNIENSTFDNNIADDYGGAVYAKNVNVNQLQSLTSFFLNNHARDNRGGAIYTVENVLMSNSKVVGNTAYEDGGGIYCEDVTVKNCEFSYNNATGSILSCFGGAIRAHNAANICGSSFANNYADSYGGAIACRQFNVQGGAYSWFEGNNCNYHMGKTYCSCSFASYIRNFDVYEGVW